MSSATAAPDLTIVIVTHNGRELALTTLRSARAATAGIAVEWIVVDSGSSDGTPDAIEEHYPDIEVLRAENRGFAAANNVGIRRALGRYILLLNPDVEVVGGTISDLVQAMDGRPHVGIASVIQRGSGGELQHSIRRFPSVGRDLGEALFAARWPVMQTLQELETRASAYENERSVDWVVGAFLIARSTAVAQVGLMDERFFLYSEEIDWCYRFAGASWDVRHLPVMTIIHHAGRRDGGDLMVQLAYSRKLFAHKHFGAFKSRGIRAALAVGHLLRIFVLAPYAIRRRGICSRLIAERRALTVQLGLAGPPRLGSSSASSVGPRRPDERTVRSAHELQPLDGRTKPECAREATPSD